ncbi:MAG: hypothetical protein IPN01_23940 [Deltaproteobacteria bacterium]|nr:hypothetical protein [Deltaproteobacteria bacterium]
MTLILFIGALTACGGAEQVASPGPSAPIPAPPAVEAPDPWSPDCATWAGIPLPAPDGALETPCAPGSPPTGAAGRTVGVLHRGVTSAEALRERYVALVTSAGWTLLTPEKRTTPGYDFTHTAYPGWVLTLDGDFKGESEDYLLGLDLELAR